MTNRPEDFWLQAWKRQLDAGLGLVEALIEASSRIREIQLEAAAQAHADVEATRKAMAAAGDLAQLAKLQSEWIQANGRKCAAYWRSMTQAVMEADAALVKCACAQTPGPLPAAFSGTDLEISKQAVLGMVDSAYKRWLDAAQRLYKPTERMSA